jgi:hypothetical protein
MQTTPRRYSRVGRPRALTEAQIEALREWHLARTTFKQQCERLGVAPATARKAIVGFDYKSPPPEKRAPRIARRIKAAADARAEAGAPGGA